MAVGGASGRRGLRALSRAEKAWPKEYARGHTKQGNEGLKILLPASITSLVL